MPNFSSDGYFITSGKSSYNSLQLSVRQRIHGLEFLAGYTYSKSLGQRFGIRRTDQSAQPGERSLSAFDVRHNFVVSYDYHLPFDRLGGPSRLVKGWRLSGITRFSTGLPVTLIETDDNSLLGTSSAGAISLPIDTPNFMPGSLQITNPRSGCRTSIPRCLLRKRSERWEPQSRVSSPARDLNNWDVALLKDTLIKEGMNLEFRAELFNAFNHAQFGEPDGNVDDLGSFGVVHTANPPASCSCRSSCCSRGVELY